MDSSLSAFSKWLSLTPASLFIQSQSLIIPAVQTLHILAIAVVLSSVGMVNLRVLGWAGARTSITDTARRYAPWMWAGLGVLLLTGIVLIVGEPERDLNNRVFQSKMALVLVLAALTLTFGQAVTRRGPAWDQAGRLSGRAKAAALATFALCLVIAVLGRWIAYALSE